MSKSRPAVAIGAAFAAATVTALAQLGLASGLAILIWRETNAESWASHLAWGAWLTAVSTVIGGTVGGRMADTIGSRITSLLAAGVGGFVVAPLIAIPAMRFAESGISIAPFAAAGIGAFAGIALTAAGLVSRAIAVNVSASIVLTWLLGGLATFIPVGDLDGPIRLGIWGSWRELFGAFGTGALSLAPPLLLGSLLIGVLTAWIAGRDETSNPRVVALSGAAGPLLLVIGYIASGQPEVGVDPQWTGIWAALYATIAGLLGSLLVTALRTRPDVKPAPADQPASPPDAPYLRVEREEAWGSAPSPFPPTDPQHGGSTDPVSTMHATTIDLPAAPEPPTPDPVTEPAPEKPAKKAKAKKPRKAKTKTDPVPVEAETPTEPAEPDSDGTASWVSELRDPDNPDPYGFDELDTHDEPTEPAPEPKKRRFGRKKST
ncbi:hypothetical protein FB566_2708 [Stackebrandtia endophytica]|uniref:Uncharacterized protein n=1 Tax=Stackebrandtia endophytica TaxID=1496996 RepID=A0A543AX55_9ACTN|nr:hypothetical protein [Stackebrandtia endophytica]TQL77158.1 hypothetical protein FB566_2708 [Stackebrandtia endophytica]